MQKFLVATLLASVATGAAVPAFAQDAMGSDSPFDGFYAGVNVGYTGATSDELFSAGSTWSFDVGDFGVLGAFTNSLAGASLGVQAGANVVLDKGFVVGGEVSVSWAAIQGTTHDFQDDYEDYNYGVYYGDFTTKIDALGAAEVKVGYTADQFMIYATAGVALANTSWTDEIGGDSYDGYWDLTATGSAVRQGWTVGVGGAVMVSPSTSIDLSYHYADFGTVDVTSNGELSTSYAGTYAGGFGKTVSLTAHTIKLGVNQHF